MFNIITLRKYNPYQYQYIIMNLLCHLFSLYIINKQTNKVLIPYNNTIHLLIIIQEQIQNYLINYLIFSILIKHFHNILQLIILYYIVINQLIISQNIIQQL